MALGKIQHKRFLSRHKVWVSVAVALVLLAAVAYAWLAQDEPSQVADQGPESAQIVDLPQPDPEPTLAKISSQNPARLIINDIEVDAPIIPVGTEPDGAMAAPKTATDIGWYDRSATLGATKRSVLLSGHYGLHIPEVLRRLNELKQGDNIDLVGTAGDTATYRVVETERQHRTEVDMEKAFNYAEGQESMSIITCIGEYDYSAGTYDDRYIVYAVRIE